MQILNAGCVIKRYDGGAKCKRIMGSGNKREIRY